MLNGDDIIPRIRTSLFVMATVSIGSSCEVLLFKRTSAMNGVAPSIDIRKNIGKINARLKKNDETQKPTKPANPKQEYRYSQFSSGSRSTASNTSRVRSAPTTPAMMSVNQKK